MDCFFNKANDPNPKTIPLNDTEIESHLLELDELIQEDTTITGLADDVLYATL